MFGNLKKQLLFFLYSTPNIVGMSLSLMGLIIFFGSIDIYWVVIVLGLYGIGYLLTPVSPTYDLQFRQQFTESEIRAELSLLTNTIKKKVSEDVYNTVKSIESSILEVLPQITQIDVNSDHNAYIIRQTALEYLPETLEHYLNLPSTFARFHTIKDGKTAQQILQDQLQLLDHTMKDVVKDLHANDAQKLLAHGRFLEEKFRKNEFVL